MSEGKINLSLIFKSFISNLEKIDESNLLKKCQQQLLGIKGILCPKFGDLLSMRVGVHLFSATTSVFLHPHNQMFQQPLAGVAKRTCL